MYHASFAEHVKKLLAWNIVSNELYIDSTRIYLSPPPPPLSLSLRDDTCHETSNLRLSLKRKISATERGRENTSFLDWREGENESPENPSASWDRSVIDHRIESRGKREFRQSGSAELSRSIGRQRNESQSDLRDRARRRAKTPTPPVRT